jgi:tetratricopeptide (TPR) repeat protein
MAKTISIAVIIVLISISLGCQSNTGSGQILPVRTTVPNYGSGPVSPQAGEIDIVDSVVKYRIDYQKSLEALVAYYSKTGNNEKQTWASNELKSLNTMVQYDYYDIIDIPGHTPSTQIYDADLLYNDAMIEKQQAEKLTQALADKNLYRSALKKFRQLIINYGTSDKIDDAAYEAGEIEENLRDYSQALTYYKASYKWNPLNTYPARFRAARILDRHLQNYAEALPIYREAVETEGKYGANLEWKNTAEERIKELEKTVK